MYKVSFMDNLKIFKSCDEKNYFYKKQKEKNFRNVTSSVIFFFLVTLHHFFCRNTNLGIVFCMYFGHAMSRLTKAILLLEMMMIEP